MKKIIIASIISLVVGFFTSMFFVSGKQGDGKLLVVTSSPITIDKFTPYEPEIKVTNSQVNSFEEGTPESTVLKWYAPLSVKEFQSVFGSGEAVPSALEAQRFIKSVSLRKASSDYLELKAKLSFFYRSIKYYYIKYYRYSNNQVTGSGVVILQDYQGKFKVIPPDLIHMKFYNFFWHLNNDALGFFINDDESKLASQSHEIIDLVNNIKNNCVDNGQLNVLTLFEEIDGLRLSSSLFEREALKTLLLKPVDKREASVISQDKLNALNLEFSDFSKEDLDLLKEFLSKKLIIESMQLIQKNRKVSLADADRLLRELGFIETPNN